MTREQANSELTARAREVLAGLTPAQRKFVARPVGWDGMYHDERSARTRVVRALNRLELIDSDGGSYVILTDLGREVTRLLAEQGGGK